MLEIALKYFRFFNVIPCSGKVPIIKWKEFTKRRMTEEEVISLFKSHAGNIGAVLLQDSRIVVLDVDSNEKLDLPRTWEARTGRGRHYYFRTDCPIQSRRLRDGIDLKGAGSVVILPPSVHLNGKRYEWVFSPQDVQLADLPDWVKREGVKRGNSISKIFGGEVQVGERNVSLTKLIGIFAKYGLSEEELLSIAFKWNRLLQSPLDKGEVIKTVKSIYQRELTNKRKIYSFIKRGNFDNLPDWVLRRITLADLKYCKKGGQDGIHSTT